MIDIEIEKVFSEPDIIPDLETEIADMYKPYNFPTLQPSNNKAKTKRATSTRSAMACARA